MTAANNFKTLITARLVSNATVEAPIEPNHSKVLPGSLRSYCRADIRDHHSDVVAPSRTDSAYHSLVQREWHDHRRMYYSCAESTVVLIS
jgi:hypothetical protein